MAKGPTEVEGTLATYASELRINDVPEQIVERTKLIILDTIGVCIRGSEARHVACTMEQFDSLGLSGGDLAGSGATTFALGERRPPTVAALTNAAGGTTLELDEGNQRSGHPAIHVVPPAIAIAEHLDSTGIELLEAIIAGYETSARIGDLNRPLKEGLHPHGEWASIGGAVATGRLLGLGTDRLTEAIRIAANPYFNVHWAAAHEGATVRNFYTGLSCHHGIQAATLAAGGVTGVEQAIDRSLLAGTAVDPPENAAKTDVVDSLGDTYYLESSYFKIHAACRYAHAPVEALERAVSGQSLAPSEIERITVRTFERGAHVDETKPENELQAKFSTPYVLAAFLVTGDTGPDVFEESNLRDERIRRLCQRVEVVADPTYTARDAGGDWGASVTVETAAGTTHEGAVRNARGGAPRPHDVDRILEKFDSLVGDTSYPIDAPTLRDRTLSIEAVNSVRTLFVDSQ